MLLGGLNNMKSRDMSAQTHSNIHGSLPSACHSDEVESSYVCKLRRLEASVKPSKPPKVAWQGVIILRIGGSLKGALRGGFA